MRSNKLVAALVLSSLLLATLMVDRAEAGKKKLIKMMLLARLAGGKKKVLIPLPFVFPIKKDWHASLDHGWHGGGDLGWHGGGGGGGWW